ncbi:MAG: trypsin-like peptidase domain-containing protein [Hyphomicrobiaceae bacterium]|nr:trypsin-like peptidase domain-containing protein [Hyphomicrobiaceae bacterium]
MAQLQTFSSFAPILEHVKPAVVTVLVTGEMLLPSELTPNPGGAARPFPEPQRVPFRSGGSGVVIDAAGGLILTNNHVVADAKAIEVSLSDGRRYEGRVVGRDPGTDVAVVSIKAPRLQEIAVGDSDLARVGDVVLAIGNPYGLEGTATLGIISATMRSSIGHEAFEDFMQIDAAINPGNSGGALVNIRGELIGINTVGSAESGKAAGIGFAIPINMARTIMRELVSKGEMRRGASGIAVSDLSRARIEQLGMRITRGVQVEAVAPRSPGAAAGIPTGAIITEFAGKPVRSTEEWETRVATSPIGSKVALRYEADGKAQRAELTIGSFQQQTKASRLGAESGALAGLGVTDIMPGDALYGSVRGIVVRDTGAGHASGLIDGDVITALDGAPVRSLAEFQRRVAGAGMQYRVTFVRGAMPAWVRVSR